VRERRLVFGEEAELVYDRARAGYSEAVVEDVLSFAGLSTRRGRGLEVGAGTGKATVAFATRGVPILALEPSAEMAGLAARNCEAFPMVKVKVSSFEDWPLEPDAFDLLFSAQAWHWVDPAVRWQKAAAALVRGGTLGFSGIAPPGAASRCEKCLTRSKQLCTERPGFGSPFTPVPAWRPSRSPWGWG
jgi:SAM-dependent methyltransferase